LKRLNPENLARLGADRLAAILIDAADLRPELKRRLRLELAAEQGAPHLLLEVDKRLTTLATGKAKVSWRQRATFIAELDALRGMIAQRLAELDPTQAIGRLWAFMALGRSLSSRVKDKDGDMEAVFERAASELGALLGKPSLERAGDEAHAAALVEAMLTFPAGWKTWLGLVLREAPAGLAAAALTRLQASASVTSGRMVLIRQLADAAGDIDAFTDTFSAEALKTPSIAAEIARRLLTVGRVAEAGAALEVAKPVKAKSFLGSGRTPEPDFEWESAWIDYLDASGQADLAQETRWIAFERTLSVARAKAFIKRLGDFDDVEAEGRAFAHAARHADFHKGLAFLMAWPALPEAAKMIQARADDIERVDDDVEMWATRLRVRQPAAAHLLLRREAAVAFRRRDLALADRLTQEADSIEAG
ncbi:MAG: hypothetical protein J0I28_04100, partial [Caulobacterales bacterium]|nr:hypothetical protein [Caulobacterales bacterium]